MITQASVLPKLKAASAEGIKIRNIFNSCGADAQVFVQDDGKAFISLLDGDVVIQNSNADIEEIKSFLDFVKPRSVFSNIATLKDLGLKNIQKANVLIRENASECEYRSDILKSDDVYKLLLSGGFKLPAYEFFATDFCRRLNKGALNYFALRDKCVGIVLVADDYCLLNGIVSVCRGFGTVALKGALSKNSDKTMLVCCEDNLKEFYFKNGFSFLYEAGYWMEKV